MRFVYWAMPLMSFSVVMFFEINSDRPWWIIPFMVSQILLLIAIDKEKDNVKKIRELERKLDALSKGGSLDDGKTH